MEKRKTNIRGIILAYALMRTWHHRIRTLIIRWACFYICIVIFGTIHLFHTSTCTCHYLHVGTNVSQSADPSKLYIRFTGSTTLVHWEGHNSFIRSEFEADETRWKAYLISFQIDLVWPQDHCWQGLQTISTSCRCFYRKLCRRRGPDIHPWDPGPR
jgi:hypothetical protein